MRFYNNTDVDISNCKECSNKVLTLLLIAYKAKRYDEVIEVAENIVKDNEAEKFYLLLGNCYNKIRNNEKALEYYQKVLTLNPKNKYAMFPLAKQYIIEKRDGDAQILLNKMLEIDPENVFAKLELGKMRLRQGRNSEAEVLLKQCLLVNPDDEHVIFELGRLYVRQGKDELAEKFLKKGLKLEENSIYAKFELAKLYSKQGNFKDAEKLLKECLETSPKDVYARLELGKIYSKTDFLKAEEIFMESLVLDPQNNLLRLELGNLYVNNNKMYKAEKVYKSVLRMEPTFIKGMIALGKLYIIQGKYGEGRSFLQKAIEFDKTNLHARIELIKLDEYKKLNPEEQRMYDYIFENINIEEYNEFEKRRHMLKHWNNDLTKKKHGVFTASLEDIRKKINLSEAKKSEFGCSEIYCVKLENCGYEGGSNGDGHQLDYVTVITMPHKKDIITIFPSDNIVLMKDKVNENDKSTEVDEER